MTSSFEQKDAVQRVKDAAERAKIELSTAQETEINQPFITASNVCSTGYFWDHRLVLPKFSGLHDFPGKAGSQDALYNKGFIYLQLTTCMMYCSPCTDSSTGRTPVDLTISKYADITAVVLRFMRFSNKDRTV